MTRTEFPRSPLLPKLESAGWSIVSDRIIRGICHDLNGRTNSLSNLAYLLGEGGSPWSDVDSVIEDEVSRLESVVRLLRLLPDDASEIGLLAPGDFLNRAPGLVHLQPGLEHIAVTVDTSPDMPAVAMDETVFFRILLLLVTGAAEGALVAGGGEVRLNSEGESRVLSIWPARSAQRPEDGFELEGLGDWLPGTMEGVVGEILEGMGGRLEPAEASGGLPGLSIHLPGVGFAGA